MLVDTTTKKLFLSVMSAISHVLILTIVLHLTRVGILHQQSRTQTPAEPKPLDEDDGNPLYFHDIFDGSIEDFSVLLNTTEAAAVLFYAPWSRSSLHFIPIFNRLAQKHHNQNLKFVSINCWEPGAGTCREAFSLRGGYPYLSFFNHLTGHVFHTGVLSEPEITAFLFKFLYPFHFADDHRGLDSYRLLSSSRILIIIAYKNDTKVADVDRGLSNFMHTSVPRSPEPVAISDWLFKMGIRSVMAGSPAVFVPSSLFPNLTHLDYPFFYMPSRELIPVPFNWTGRLPTIRKANAERPVNLSEAIEQQKLVDRAVVAVVNSFEENAGAHLCSRTVAIVRTASWLYDACSDDVMTDIEDSLAKERKRCERLGFINGKSDGEEMLSHEDLNTLKAIKGLACRDNLHQQRSRTATTRLDTAFSVVERQAGHGVIHNKSALGPSSGHVGPRRPLDLASGIYLLDGKQETAPKIVSSANEVVEWLKEESPVDEVPPVLPNTKVATLVYYDAPWCNFCGMLTPRVLIAKRVLQQVLTPSHFVFVRVTDSDMLNADLAYSVPHYPALVFYPRGTENSQVTHVIPHSPGEWIVPSVFSQLTPADKLLACVISSNRHQKSAAVYASCLCRQLRSIRRIQRQLWTRQDEISDFHVATSTTRLVVFRHLSRLDWQLRLLLRPTSSAGLLLRVSNEVDQLSSLIQF